MAGPNNWEFLLQQEGDRSWLPLESPDVEILEGRYRVMVKTAVPDTMMDIRITHESTDEFPTKRRTQVRSGETSAKGLLLVIPFTQMQPGIWELAIGVPHDASRDEARGAKHCGGEFCCRSSASVADAALSFTFGATRYRFGDEFGNA